MEVAVTKIDIKPLIRKESLLFSKETSQGELEVRKFKDGTYHVFVNNEEHAWFDKDDLTSLKYYLKYKKDIPEDEIVLESLKEDTVQKANGKWTNRGDDGTEHGEFDTKAEADAQRKAMFASGWKGESLSESVSVNLGDIVNYHDKQYVVIDDSSDDLLVLRPSDRFKETDFDDIESGDNSEDIYIAPYQLLNTLEESFKDTNLYRDLVAKVANAIRLCGSEEESVGLDEDNTIVFKLKYGITKHQINDLYDMLEDISSHDSIKEFQINTLPWTGDTYVLVVPDVDFSDEQLKEELKTYYVSYKENEGKFKGKYVDLPIKANSKAEAEEKFLKDYPNTKSYDYKVTDGEYESLDEKLNLDKEGKALKRAIKSIIVDNDDELREFVSAIVEEVISERNSLEESVDDPEEFNVGDRVSFNGRPEENREILVSGVGVVILKNGRIYKVKVIDRGLNTKNGQVVTIDGMYLYGSVVL